MILASVVRKGPSPVNSLNTKVTYREARKLLKDFGFKVPWTRRTAWILSQLPRDVYIQTAKLLEMVKDRKEENLKISRPLPLILCSSKSLITLGPDNIKKIMNHEESMEQIYERAFQLEVPVVDLTTIPFVFNTYTALKSK